jgi:hydrogenase maturation protease
MWCGAEAVRTLLIGYGNPGRGDDGLGPALAEAIAALGLPDLMVDIDFQLNVEDAWDLTGYDRAIFADAAVEGAEPFFWKELEPADSAEFSSHAASPAGVLKLAKDLFNAKVRGFVIGIRGYEFDVFGAPMTPRAQDNLRQAIAFLATTLRVGEMEPTAPA